MVTIYKPNANSLQVIGTVNNDWPTTMLRHTLTNAGGLGLLSYDGARVIDRDGAFDYSLLDSSSEIEPLGEFANQSFATGGAWGFSGGPHGGYTLVRTRQGLGPTFSASVDDLQVGETIEADAYTLDQSITLKGAWSGTPVIGHMTLSYVFCDDHFRLITTTLANPAVAAYLRTYYQAAAPCGADINQLVIDGGTTRTLLRNNQQHNGAAGGSFILSSSNHPYFVQYDLDGTQDYTHDAAGLGIFVNDAAAGPKVYSCFASNASNTNWPKLSFLRTAMTVWFCK